jgi:hypothetical protein
VSARDSPIGDRIDVDGIAGGAPQDHRPRRGALGAGHPSAGETEIIMSATRSAFGGVGRNEQPLPESRTLRRGGEWEAPDGSGQGFSLARSDSRGNSIIVMPSSLCDSSTSRPAGDRIRLTAR